MHFFFWGHFSHEWNEILPRNSNAQSVKILLLNFLALSEKKNTVKNIKMRHIIERIFKYLIRTCTKNKWKGLLVHTLNSKIFTLDPTTPQIFRSKKLSGMIWNVSKLSQNEQIYMFFLIFVHKMTSNVQKYVNLLILTQFWDVPYHSR